MKKVLTGLATGLCALAILLAPHAAANTNDYLSCVGRNAPGNPSTSLSLGREAYNAVKSSSAPQAVVLESLNLMGKYGLSETQASAIVGCALTYPLN